MLNLFLIALLKAYYFIERKQQKHEQKKCKYGPQKFRMKDRFNRPNKNGPRLTRKDPQKLSALICPLNH